METTSNDVSDKAIAFIDSVLENNLTYLEKEALIDLNQAVLSIERRQVNGLFLEAGCALGGSSLVIASEKAQKRPFYVYDVFGMIPPPSEADDIDIHDRYKTILSGTSKGIGTDKYYGYEENLLHKIKQTFETFELPLNENNIYLVPGLYEETLVLQEPIAFAHIDCDWHDSVMVCLQRIEPFLVSGGLLTIDDYSAWSGCRKAVDSYFNNRKDEFVFVMKSRLHILKK